MFAVKTGIEWLAVFLGNPGARYENTRHNAGFMAAGAFADKAGVEIKRFRFNALTGNCVISGQRTLLIMPQTFMNLSGDSVSLAVGFYKIPAERVLVVADDAALPLGVLRIRRKGSSGGHNGLKSIISRLGTEEFPRIKIGVGIPGNPQMGMVDWVIGSMSASELQTLKKSASAAAEAVETYISNGPDAAMNLYN